MHKRCSMEHTEKTVLEEQHRKAFTVHFHNTISKIKKKRDKEERQKKRNKIWSVTEENTEP